jgi:hypothetical protein
MSFANRNRSASWKEEESSLTAAAANPPPALQLQLPPLEAVSRVAPRVTTAAQS